MWPSSRTLAREKSFAIGVQTEAPRVQRGFYPAMTLRGRFHQISIYGGEASGDSVWVVQKRGAVLRLRIGLGLDVHIKQLQGGNSLPSLESVGS